MTSITFDTRLLDEPRQSAGDDRKVRFDQLVGVHLDDLYRYGYWLVGNRSVAEDLVQDTMLRAWRALDKLENPKAAKGWLITILRRENARRFERIRPQLSEQPTETLPDKHCDYDTSTEAFVLRQAIEELPADYREPLLLQVLYGYSQKEIAAELGISPAGVGTRLFRARAKLRERLSGSEEQTA